MFLLSLWPTWVFWAQIAPFLQSLEEEKQWREIMDTEEGEKKERPWAVGWGKEEQAGMQGGEPPGLAC